MKTLTLLLLSLILVGCCNGTGPRAAAELPSDNIDINISAES